MGTWFCGNMELKLKFLEPKTFWWTLWPCVYACACLEGMCSKVWKGFRKLKEFGVFFSGPLSKEL